MRSGILAAGNWLIDHVKLIDAWPPQDGLANITGQSAHNGGGPYNVLKDLAKLRAPFPLAGLGLVGDDENGRTIVADCAAHGIDTARLRVRSGAGTGYTDVMTVRATGRRTFFHHRGANAQLGPADFDFTGVNARHLHLAYLLLLDALDSPGADGRPRAAEVLARARAAGLRTSLDCVSENSDRFQSVVLPVLPEVDVLFTNDYEAEKLTGLTLGRGDSLDRTQIEAAGRTLIAAGVRDWVILHYPEGACAVGRSGAVHFQGAVRLPPAEIAGTVGAGDAFAAGVLYGLHERWPMERCLELGVGVAAASLRHPSCSEAVPPADECLAMGRRYGHR
ncbi:MAG: carbohydrate kinase family protein [Opitutaceae bacterium]|nr:carbohydrate kinase family protein [Opitutaceae bacterium]